MKTVQMLNKQDSDTRILERIKGEIIEAVENDDNLGFCLSCGFCQGCCEPDARNYKCENCGERRVFGAQELLFRIAF